MVDWADPPWVNGGWHPGWWPLVPLTVLAVFATIAVLLWRAGRGQADPLDSARRILADRYARGEIDAAEYHERLANLTPPTTRRRRDRRPDEP